MAALVAFPSRLAHKSLGVLIGVLGLSLVNLARTVSLYYVGAFYPDLLDLSHLVVWQSLMIVFAILLWLLWARGAARHA